MFKLAVFDLDGTLLDKNHEISEQNLIALKKLEKNNCKIVLATGRSDLLMKEYVKKLNIKTPVISCNGGMIRNPMTKELWDKRVMPVENVKQIIEICEHENYIYMVYSEDFIFTIPNKRLEYFENRNKKLDTDCQIEFMVSKSVDEILNYEIYKILIIEEDSIRFSRLKEQFTEVHGLEVCQSSQGLMDFMVEGTSKKRAIEYLATIYGIEPSEIVAFGDNYNDLEMLNYAGCAITTSNAVDEVKAISDYISIDHSESGVAWAIENYIFKNKCTNVQKD